MGCKCCTHKTNYFRRYDEKSQFYQVQHDRPLLNEHVPMFTHLWFYQKSLTDPFKVKLTWNSQKKRKLAIPREQNYLAWLMKNNKTVFSKRIMLNSLAGCLTELCTSDFYWILFSFRLSLTFWLRYQLLTFFQAASQILLLRHFQNNYQIWLYKLNLMCEEVSYQIINIYFSCQ